MLLRAPLVIVAVAMAIGVAAGRFVSASPLAWGLLYDPTDGVAVDLARRFESEAGRLGVQALTETSTAAATDADGLARLRQRGAKVIYLAPAASTTASAARSPSRCCG